MRLRQPEQALGAFQRCVSGSWEHNRLAYLADALLDLYATRGVATSIALRGIASFGPHRIVRSDESLSLSENLPITVIATDTAEVISAVADDAAGLIRRGLVTVERARQQTPADGAVRLSVYLGRQQRIGGEPADVATTALLHRLGFAGVVVHLGVDGTADDQQILHAALKTGPVHEFTLRRPSLTDLFREVVAA